jgi:hypothetical protein
LKIYWNNIFYFLKFIFNINTLKRSENTKTINFFKKYFKKYSFKTLKKNQKKKKHFLSHKNYFKNAHTTKNLKEEKGSYWIVSIPSMHLYRVIVKILNWWILIFIVKSLWCQDCVFYGDYSCFFKVFFILIHPNNKKKLIWSISAFQTLPKLIFHFFLKKRILDYLKLFRNPNHSTVLEKK